MLAEEFVREIVDGRYDRAEEYLSDSMAGRVAPEALKHLARRQPLAQESTIGIPMPLMIALLHSGVAPSTSGNA